MTLALPGQPLADIELQDKLDAIAMAFPTGPYVDVKRSFGAHGDGVTDDAPAINAAITATAIRGGTVFFPPGNYITTSPLAVTDLQDGSGISTNVSVELLGSGPRASVITYTPASSSLLQNKSSSSTRVANLGLRYNNAAYNADLITCGWSTASADSSELLFDRCIIGGTSSSAKSARSLINLDHAITSKIQNCRFEYADVAIWGVDGHYSVSNAIENCAFPIGRITSHTIRNPGERWGIRDCTFEALANGKSSAIYSDNGVTTWALSLANNWYGDVSVNGGNWIEFHGLVLGLSAQAERFSSPGAAANNASIQFNNATNTAINVGGCKFEGHTGIGFLGVSNGVSIMGNDFGTTTTPVQALANLTARATIQSNVGIVDQYVA